MKKRLAFLSFEVRWWYWVALSVAWLMLCVWVRLEALDSGRYMNQELARHNELLARVQADERALTEVRQLENMEKHAALMGFSKMSAGSLIIVPPESGGGFLSRILGGDKQASREEVEPQTEPGAASVKKSRKSKRSSSPRARVKNKI